MATAHPLVLFRTPYFRGPVPVDRVPEALRRHFTADQSQLREAEAIVFHIPDWRRFDLEDTPKYPGQLWVAWSMESAINYPRLADQSFMRHFDLVLGYRQSSDIWSSYLPERHRWQAMPGLTRPTEPEAAPLVAFQSALTDGSGRNAFFASLQQHIDIDSYGRVFRNRTLPVDNGRQTKLDTIARYPFCLSLENAIEPDYVTEKLFDPLLAGTLPVYRGAPNAAEFAPEHSFIDAEAHGGPAGLAAYLRHLLTTPEAYWAYFAWRDKPLPRWLEDKLDATATPPWLRLLERLSARGPERHHGRATLPFGLPNALSAKARRMLRRVAGKPSSRVELQ